MISTKAFQKLLVEKHKLQAQYEKLFYRRMELQSRVSDLDDDLTAVAYDITQITKRMVEEKV